MSSRRRTYFNNLLSEMKYIKRIIRKYTNTGVNTLIPAEELSECSGLMLIFYPEDSYINNGKADYCIIDAILDGGATSYNVPNGVSSTSDRLVFERDEGVYTNTFRFSRSTGLTCQSVYKGGGDTSTVIKCLLVIGI